MKHARWFPLVPRPRPPGDCLHARVERLTAAGRIARFGSGQDAMMAAAQVYNGAALLASDVGFPDLAREWCWEHARKHLAHLPLDTTGAQRALEPVVNLARLRIRAGEGTEAFAMLTALRDGIRTATPTMIDGYELPLDQLTASEEDRVELHRWVWTVCLGDGVRALAAEGRWREAAEQARQHGGIGDRLFDGRQVAAITALTSGHAKAALDIVRGSEVQEPWERAVQAALALWCRKESGEPAGDDVETAVNRVRTVESRQIVFTTRLGIVTTELLGGVHGGASALVAQLTSAVIRTQDGYAARDLLSGCEGELAPDQVRSLIPVLEVAGLGQKTFPEPILHELRAATVEAGRRLEMRSAPA